MENKKIDKKEDTLLLPSFCALGFGVFSFSINPLMGIATSIAGIGGLLTSSGILKLSSGKNVKDATKNVSLIEKIFFETGMRKIELDSNKKPICIIPKVLGIRDEGSKRIVDLKVPMGFSMRELNQRCYYALKDYFNCIEIEFNTKGNCLYEMVLIYEASKPKELNTWDKFWLNVGIYNGEKPNYEFPKLLGNREINGGLQFIFQLPLGKSSHHLTKIDTTIKEFINARSVEIEHIRGTKDGVVVAINAIIKDIPNLVPFSLDGIEDKDNFKILLGESVYGKVYTDLIKSPHLLLAGTTNSGKSAMLKSILMYLFCKYNPKDLEVYLSDLKVTELSRFKNIKHVKKCVNNVSDTHTMLQDVLKECNRRFTLFSNKGNMSNLEDYNKRVSSSEKLPYMFVVVEEYVRYTNGGGNDVKERQTVLNDLISVCRAAGIYVCLTIQRPTKSSLGDILKANINNKIGFKTADDENSKVICGDNKLLCGLKGYGHGYLCIGMDKTEFKAMYLNDTDISKLIKTYKLEK